MCATCDMIRGLLMAQGVSQTLATDLGALAAPIEATVVKVAKKKTSAYSRRYKAAFAKVKSDFMTNAGKWKKNGFKRAVRAAHKIARR